MLKCDLKRNALSKPPYFFNLPCLRLLIRVPAKIATVTSRIEFGNQISFSSVFSTADDVVHPSRPRQLPLVNPR